MDSRPPTYAQVSSSPSLEVDKLSHEDEVPRLKNGSMLEQSTTAYAQVPSCPSLEVDKLRPEEEVRRFKNGNDGLVLEATQPRQHGQVSHEVSQEPQTFESANLALHTFLAENGVQWEEPLQDDLWALLDAMPVETSAEIEQPETESELPEPFYLELESVGLGAQPKEPLQDHVWDDSFVTAIAEGGGIMTRQQVSHEVSQEPQTLESADVLPHTFPAENGAQLKAWLEELLQDDLRDLVDAMPFETSAEIKQSKTESELAEPFYWDFESVGLGSQPKEPLPDHVRDDSFEAANASSARKRNRPGRMEKRKKRVRVSNWNHAHTMALAELKREASLNEEYGPLVWDRIARTLSSRFPDQIRTGAQCRRRWDTLVKVYNHIQNYCVETGAEDHRELDEGELASMKLDTAYQQDWYDIVEQVCSQRKWKERCDRDRMLAMRSKGSHSVELPEYRYTLCSASTSKSVTHREQSIPESTTTYAQVSSSPSLEADELSHEDEVPRLKNGNDDLMLEATQLRQHGQVSHEEAVGTAFDMGYMGLQNLFDDIWALVDGVSRFGVSAEIEQSETESELTEPFYRYLESVGLGARPKEPLQDLVRDDSSVTAIAQGGGMINLNDLILTKFNNGYSTRTNDDHSTISLQSQVPRRWSLEVILLKIRQCCHACGRKERIEDMEMESKQAARLKEKARKKALMPRKENVPAMLNAASSTSATSATREDKPLQKDTQRISKQAALDKKEEETMTRKAERQQLGGKSSSKCVPIGKLCAKLSRKLFMANPHISFVINHGLSKGKAWFRW